MQRALRFVSRTSKDKTFTLRDGRKVRRNQVALVDAVEAQQLLRNPGADTDEGAEWVPAARDEVEVF